MNLKKEAHSCVYAINVVCLRCTRRKTGPSCWEFLWRENDADGNRTRRTAVIGTVEQLPTRDLAEVAVNGLRVGINQHRIRQREQSIVVADLVDHYIQTELSDEAGWHSHATRIVYSEFLKRWIRPHWADMGIRDVRTVLWNAGSSSCVVTTENAWRMRPRQKYGIS